MKKILLLLICLALISCKAKDKTDNSGLQAAAQAKQGVISTGSTSKSTTRDPSKIDLDLTQMSSTMIYSTMFDMLVMPEDYVEKNIKL